MRGRSGCGRCAAVTKKAAMNTAYLCPRAHEQGFLDTCLWSCRVEGGRVSLDAAKLRPPRRTSCLLRPPLPHIRRFTFWQSDGERVREEAAVSLWMTTWRPERAKNFPKVTQPRSSFRFQSQTGPPGSQPGTHSLCTERGLPHSFPGERLLILLDLIQRPLPSSPDEFMPCSKLAGFFRANSVMLLPRLSGWNVEGESWSFDPSSALCCPDLSVPQGPYL